MAGDLRGGGLSAQDPLGPLTDAIVAMARLEFDQVPAVDGEGPYAAIAAGLAALSEELRANVVARDEAEAANRAKDEFMANMSHELRTPLTSILGSASLLAQGRLDPGQRALCERIVEASAALQRLVDDVLDFTRLDAGTLDLDPQPTCLGQRLAELEASSARRARAKGLLWVPQPWNPPPAPVVCDADRVAQVFENLADNALKFTARGTIRAGLDHRPRADGVDVVIEVEDTGDGIPEGLQQSILGHFVQADGSLRRAHSGLGLGLSICSALARQMDGELSFDSEPGRGSCFRLRFFAPYGPHPPRPEPLPLPSASRPRVLAVDDNPALLELMGAMLEALGYDAVSAPSGQEALDRLARDRFDLVLMDVQMPHMDGLETTRRALARDADLRVVAVTAHSRPEDRRMCLKAGMVDHLAKPFTLQQLREMIAEHLAANARPA